jgi:hypothetical protein
MKVKNMGLKLRYQPAQFKGCSEHPRGSASRGRKDFNPVAGIQHFG